MILMDLQGGHSTDSVVTFGARRGPFALRAYKVGLIHQWPWNSTRSVMANREVFMLELNGRELFLPDTVVHMQILVLQDQCKTNPVLIRFMIASNRTAQKATMPTLCKTAPIL